LAFPSYNIKKSNVYNSLSLSFRQEKKKKDKKQVIGC